MTHKAARPGWMLLLLSLLVLHATPSQAHAVGVSRGEYRLDGAQIHADLVFAREELQATLPGLDADRDGDLTSGEIASARGELSEWVHRGIVVRVPTGPCPGGLEAATLTEQDGVELAAVYRCPQQAMAFSVRLGLLAELSLGHRHLLTAMSPSQTVRTVLYDAQPEVDLAAPSTVAGELGSVGPSLFRLGIQHILTGYDHLLFLLALVLVGGPLRSVLGMVTAFTLAHSVTLAVAALGIWAPRPTLVEPAIALSIAYVGIENCVALDLRRRWRLTFLFGLIHGFGFAGALREVAVSAVQLPLALASFNVGVEAGQLAVLAIVLPLVWWLGRHAWFASGGLQVSSIAVSAIGLLWFVVRVTSG
jgi:hydrogenase/urease accessory protein HupE